MESGTLNDANSHSLVKHRAYLQKCPILTIGNLTTRILSVTTIDSNAKSNDI